MKNIKKGNSKKQLTIKTAVKAGQLDGGFLVGSIAIPNNFNLSNYDKFQMWAIEPVQ